MVGKPDCLLPIDDGVLSIERNDEGFVMANYLRGRVTQHGFVPRVYVMQHCWDGNDSFSELGNMVSAGDDGFLIAFTSNHSKSKTAAALTSQNAINTERALWRDLAVMRVKKDFLKKCDATWQAGTNKHPIWKRKNTASSNEFPRVPDGQVFAFNAASTTSPGFKYLTKYEAGKQYSASRPKIVPVTGGNYVVIWERWTHSSVLVKVKNAAGQIVDSASVKGIYDSTWAMLIDKDGNTLKNEKLISQTARIHRGDDPLQVNGKAAWVTGDMVQNKLVLHTVDKDLNYVPIDLSL